MCEQMKYNVIGTMIIANTVDLRVYSEERREERAVLNRGEHARSS